MDAVDSWVLQFEVQLLLLGVVCKAVLMRAAVGGLVNMMAVTKRWLRSCCSVSFPPK